MGFVRAQAAKNSPDRFGRIAEHPNAIKKFERAANVLRRYRSYLHDDQHWADNDRKRLQHLIKNLLGESKPTKIIDSVIEVLSFSDNVLSVHLPQS